MDRDKLLHQINSAQTLAECDAAEAAGAAWLRDHPDDIEVSTALTIPHKMRDPGVQAALLVRESRRAPST